MGRLFPSGSYNKDIKKVQNFSGFLCLESGYADPEPTLLINISFLRYKAILI